jgi:predicted nucleic acid-binding Zn ribbon protein
MLRLVTVASVLSSNLGARPAPVIDTTNDSATTYWATRLNVSSDDLAAAIQEVGPSVAAVRRYLGK